MNVDLFAMLHVPSNGKIYRQYRCITRKNEAYLISATILGLILWSVILNSIQVGKVYWKNSSKQSFPAKNNKMEILHGSRVIPVLRNLKKFENNELPKYDNFIRPIYKNKIMQSCCYDSVSTYKNKEQRNMSTFLRLRMASDSNTNNTTTLGKYIRAIQTNVTDRTTSQIKTEKKNLRRPMRRLPQAIIVGVKKSGTRALLEYLRLHPDIRAPGPEPHFFDWHYHLGLDWYRRKMPPTIESQITIEKTPRYFVMPEVPSRISAMSKDIKLIIVVRDPVTRAISDFTQGSSKAPSVTETFVEKAFLRNGSGGVHKNWSAIKTGLYVSHVKRWMNYFSLRQMHFVNGENLISKPAEEVQRVTDFLNLKRAISDKHFYFNGTKGFPCLKKHVLGPEIKCFDRSKGRPHPIVADVYIERLRQFYKPYNEEFYHLVGQNFGWP